MDVAFDEGEIIRNRKCDVEVGDAVEVGVGVEVLAECSLDGGGGLLSVDGEDENGVLDGEDVFDVFKEVDEEVGSAAVEFVDEDDEGAIGLGDFSGVFGEKGFEFGDGIFDLLVGVEFFVGDGSGHF